MDITDRASLLEGIDNKNKSNDKMRRKDGINDPAYEVMPVNESFPNPTEVNWSPMEEYSPAQVLQKADPLPSLKSQTG